MRKILFPLLILLIAACQAPVIQDKNKTGTVHKETAQSVRQADRKTVVDTIVDPILKIRQKVERINKQKLKVRHTEFTCDALMKVDRFYEKEELVKITIDFGTVGDVYAREDYYYDQGNLIFKYEFVEGGPACEGCVKKNEYRSYIENNQVIKYLKDQHEEECRSCSFERRSRYYQLLKASTNREIKGIFCR